MADLLPVDKVSAVKDGDCGEVFKGGGHQVIVLSYTADAGVRMHSGNNGIFVWHIFHSFLQSQSEGSSLRFYNKVSLYYRKNGKNTRKRGDKV